MNVLSECKDTDKMGIYTISCLEKALFFQLHTDNMVYERNVGDAGFVVIQRVGYNLVWI